MTIYERGAVAFIQRWKAGTEGNYFVHGDTVAAAFGDAIMFRSDLSAPSGVVQNSKVTIDLPAITPANYGKKIQVHCVYAGGQYPTYYHYPEISVAGRVLLKPAAGDGINDILDDYVQYGDPYTAQEFGFEHTESYPLDGGTPLSPYQRSPQCGPYTVTLTAVPPSSDDVHTTGGRWVVDSATNTLPVKAHQYRSGIYSLVLAITNAELTAVAEIQEFAFGAAADDVFPQEDLLFLGMHVRVITPMTDVSTNVSARWGPATANLGLWGSISSSFPVVGGGSLHTAVRTMIGPVTLGEQAFLPEGTSNVKIELNTNGGGNLSTVTAFSAEFKLLYASAYGARLLAR